MRNYKSYDLFPVLCRTCRAVTTINRIDPTPQACSRCGGSDYLRYGQDTRIAAEFAKFQSEYTERQAAELADLLNKLKSDPEALKESIGMKEEASEVAEQILTDIYTEGPSTDWDAGLHLCPKCNMHSLRIDRTERFFD